jgi:hypothetical protein
LKDIFVVIIVLATTCFARSKDAAERRWVRSSNIDSVLLLLVILLVRERTCSHLFSLFVLGKCMESAPTPSTNLVREPQSPALAGVSTVLETCAQAAGFQSAEDVVPCFSQGDCDGYDTEFGEPCCLVRYVIADVVMLPYYCKDIVILQLLWILL